MSKVTLDKGFDLDVQDGEVVIYAHKVAQGGLKNLGKQFCMAITNKRIAIVAPKTGETETINYNELLHAKFKAASPDDAIGNFNLVFHEKTKMLGFIPVHKKRPFGVKGGWGESFALLGKHMAQEAKVVVANIASTMDYQQRRQAIEARNDLSDQQKQWAMDEAWMKVDKEWGEMFEKTAIHHKKPKPTQRMTLMITLINDAIKLSQ